MSFLYKKKNKFIIILLLSIITAYIIKLNIEYNKQQEMEDLNQASTSNGSNESHRNGKKINAIITGATGMLGEGVIFTAIASDDVEKILLVNRRESGIKHEKVKEIIHNDLSNLTEIQNELKGYDSVYFCAGASSVGMSKEDYYNISYTMPIEMLNTVARINNLKSKDDNDMTFIYVSAAGTGEDSWQTWARVKAKTENEVIASPFNKAFGYRPAWVNPNINGLKRSYKTYKYIGWFYPIGRSLSQNGFVTMKEFGQGMINASKFGYNKTIIAGSDMVKLTNTK